MQHPSRQPVHAAVTAEPGHVRLLWTGGWDSTFQLLRLLLVQGRHVTPYYLMRDRRPSVPFELETMTRIR